MITIKGGPASEFWVSDLWLQFLRNQNIFRKSQKGQIEIHISMTTFISGRVKKRISFLIHLLVFLPTMLLLTHDDSDFKNKISQMKRLDDATPGMETNGNHLGKIFRFFYLNFYL